MAPRSLFGLALLLVASACSSSPPIDTFTPPATTKKPDDDTGKKGPNKKTEPTETPAPAGNTPPPATPQPDQPPTLATISPDSITLGQSTGSVEVTLSGTRFPTSASVDVNGTPIPAAVQSGQSLKVTIPADKLKAAGSLRLSVVAKPGLVSNALSFTIANPTTITITTLNPSNVVLTDAAAAVPLTVTGSGFTQQSVVKFNGANLPSTFTDATTLKATIPAVAFVATGRFGVTVATGTDVVSLPSPFEVRNPSPTATTVAPSSLTVGDAATVVTMTGTSFTKASEVFAGTTPLATTFVSSTSLRATLPSAQLANAGSVSLTVKTGEPGGGTSTAVALTVKAGQTKSTGPSCAYKCADYGYSPFVCYSNWYCIGTGDNAGCLANITCTDTDQGSGNPNESTQTACTYKCADYAYAPGECNSGWYCRYSDSCLVQDDTCKTAATTTTTNACKYACSDYGYVKGECSYGYYCQYADGCLVEDSTCSGSSGASTTASNACTYACTDYGYKPAECASGYYCRVSDGCLEADSTCP